MARRVLQLPVQPSYGRKTEWMRACAWRIASD